MAPRVKEKTAVKRSQESSSSGGKALNRSKKPEKTAVNRSKVSTTLGGKEMNRSKTPADATKRARVITWDQYFMGIALIAAQRSKDPITQVGACIVNRKKRIVGIGYNGMPDRGILHNDDKFSWNKSAEYEKNKHLYVCHAEMNAIVNKMDADIQDCTLYTTLYPCNECSKLMIQSGIKKVVYLDEKDPDKDIYQASKVLLYTANIKIKKYQPTGNSEDLFQALKRL